MRIPWNSYARVRIVGPRWSFSRLKWPRNWDTSLANSSLIFHSVSELPQRRSERPKWGPIVTGGCDAHEQHFCVSCLRVQLFMKEWWTVRHFCASGWRVQHSSASCRTVHDLCASGEQYGTFALHAGQYATLCASGEHYGTFALHAGQYAAL